MAAKECSARRAKYLDELSRSLTITSPIVAAYLRSCERADETSTRPVETNNTCSSCGNSLMLGWNCKKAVGKTSKRRTRQDRLAGKPISTSVECDMCHTIVELTVSKPARKQTGRRLHDTVVKATSPKMAASEGRKQSSSPATVADVSNKKRSRNKKSSLQALLADKKPAAQKKGFGLGLEDFLK